MIRTVPGAFRADSLNINVTDNAGASLLPFKSVRSNGGTIIDTASIAPGISSKWKLQALSIQGYMAIVNGGAQLFGKPGKTIGGIILPPNNPQPTGTSAEPGIQPMLPLPPDPTLTMTLWDPDLDPNLPQINTSFTPGNTPIDAFLPISGQLQLPQSVSLQPGEPITIAMWRLPSILGSAASVTATAFVAVFLSTYALTYDDGL